MLFSISESVTAIAVWITGTGYGIGQGERTDQVISQLALVYLC